MVTRINQIYINDYQWRIGGFLINYLSMHFFKRSILRNFRYLTNKERNRKRNSLGGSGLNQQPDCIVIMNADRESSVILKANRL
eukprot:Gb_23664 [translate_table: standard]